MRWIVAQGSGSKWFEYRTERLPDDQGFRVQLWNRLPWAESTLSLATNDLGLPAPAGPKGAVHRTVFWLRDVEGLSNQEVGEILGLSLPAVKSRILRARLHLRDRLAPHLEVTGRGA